MSVILGPDGQPITTGTAVADPTSQDCLEINKTEMATDAKRARAVKEVMDFRMSHVKRFVEMMESMARGNKHLTLGPSDDYGQCPLLEDGVDTGHKIAADVAKDYRSKDWGEGANDEI